MGNMSTRTQAEIEADARRTGRPPKIAGLSARVETRVPASIYEALTAIAARRGLTRPDVARLAIEQYVGRSVRRAGNA